MIRFRFFLPGILSAALLCFSGNAAPNIVFIISDDMGYSDLGCYGGEIETPHLDALAEKGLRFTNYYVNNMCWPTRASLMTGLYPRTALPKNGSADGGLHPEATTLPAALRAAGYQTWMSGKWHLSSAGEPDGPNAPHHRGFDQFYGTIHGASDFFAPSDLQWNGKDRTEEWQGKSDYYYTDVTTDYALRFLKEGDEEKPFFLYLAYTAAHWPLHAHPEDIAHYEGRYEKGWDELRLERHRRMKELGVVDPSWKLSPRHPDVPAWEDAENKDWQQRRMEVYA
ncbi:MAG: sulfatase-like hydrolase/transferase, partial [Verrucomicrobiales bacterium]|nr:sulfatase-like hydrolase/transferase [Verrucomicrobiales bacterium]